MIILSNVSCFESVAGSGQWSSGRQTQQLGNLGSDGGPRVPAPERRSRHVGYAIARTAGTTTMSPGSSRYGNGNSNKRTIRQSDQQNLSNGFLRSPAPQEV